MRRDPACSTWLYGPVILTPLLFPSWMTLRSMLVSFWKTPDATPEQMGVVRAYQFRAVVNQLPLITLSTIVLLSVIMAAFWDVIDRTLVISVSVPLVVFNSANVYLWWYWFRKPTDIRISENLCWALGLDVLTLAILDVILAVHVFGVGDPSQRLLMIGISAAVMATGGWMFSALQHTGLAWSIGVCGFGAIGMGMNFWDEYPLLILLIAFYGLVLTATVLINSRVVLQSISTALALEKQNHVVGLLLNDFEENASDWLWEIDKRGRLKHAPQRLAQAVGLSVKDLRTRKLLPLLDGLAPADEASRYLHYQLADAFDQGHAFRDMLIPVMVDGRKRWWSMTAKPLVHSARGMLGWRGVGSDVTELKERDMELTRLANVDSLTGLANRHHFNQALNANFPQGGPVHPCTLFLFDLDNFKHVNDLMGHVTGDALLCEVSRRLAEEVEHGMLLARLGGDEFALLLPHAVDRQTATQLANRLQDVFHAPCVVDEHQIDIHASIGVASAPDDASSPSDLLKACDLALYAAKAAGRHTMRFYDAQMDAAVREKLSMLADLKQAIAREEFVVHYQPQIDLISHQLVGFEALVRWQHPVRGLVPPLHFIPVAEDSGLIIPLGQWVLSQACKDAVTWPAHLRVAVNISAVEFERSNLRASVDMALAQSGLEPQRLELELTESTLMHDSDATLTLLHGLRGAGVRLSLDDFGTGFSSLAYLRNFPLDQLKIDRSFVRPLGTADEGSSALAVVQAIHGLAQALGLEVIAEGVETGEQHELLMQVGRLLAQGYKFARPMPADHAYQFAQLCATDGLVVACESLQRGDLMTPRKVPSDAMM